MFGIKKAVAQGEVIFHLAIIGLSCGGREYPRKWQNSKEFRLGRLPVPAAIGIGAGKVLVAEYLHRLDFRQGGIGAPLLYIDIVAALRALKNDSIG
jgi:hypothetical protein